MDFCAKLFCDEFYVIQMMTMRVTVLYLLSLFMQICVDFDIVVVFLRESFGIQLVTK